MALAFLLDEHLRGPLWSAIQRHNLVSEYPLEVVRVGDPEDLPLGSSDAEVLQWAEREQRIIITEDRHTMPTHLARHLEGGRHCPGVFVVRGKASRKELLECLTLVAYASEQREYANVVTFIP